MLFRPTFCANCGEKIERTDWGLFTSRRFCQVCESQYKGHDLIPRVVVAGGVMLAILGLGTYLRSSGTPEPLVTRAAVTQPVEHQPVVERPQKAVAEPVLPDANIAANTATNARSLAALSNVKTLVDAGTKPAEQLYYCGAQTKKGTPCSRKVKGNVRCYQHTGMAAMLPADKLKVQ